MIDEDRLIPREGETELAAAKQYFYTYFSSPETLAKVYSKRVLVDIESLNRLNERICHKLKHYRHAGFLIEAKVKHSDKEMITFNNWESFMNNDWNKDAETESIHITWKINLILPNHSTPHLHKISLNISNGMKPEEMLKLLFSNRLDDVDSLDMESNPLYATITFIDRTVADELVDLISKWVSSLDLPEKKLNKTVLFLRKYRQIVGYSVEYLSTFILLIFPSLLFLNKLYLINVPVIGQLQTDAFKELISYFIAICFIFVYSNRVARLLARFIFRILNDYGISHTFVITNKDKRIVNQLQTDSRKSIVKLLIGLLGIIASSCIGKLVDFLLSSIIGG